MPAAPTHAVAAFAALSARVASSAALTAAVDAVAARAPEDESLSPAAPSALALLAAADVSALDATRAVAEALREHTRGAWTEARGGRACASVYIYVFCLGE